jgi:hypothetical protein
MMVSIVNRKIITRRKSNINIIVAPVSVCTLHNSSPIKRALPKGWVFCLVKICVLTRITKQNVKTYKFSQDKKPNLLEELF